MDKIVNPEILILARESRGMTQSELANLTGITQGCISKYESSLLSTPAIHLEAISEVLDYPVFFFFQPGRRYAFGSSCTYHRKRQTMPVGDLKRLLAQINIRRLELARFLNNVDIEKQNEFPRFDIEDFDSDAEEIAYKVRRFWRLPAGPISDLSATIEAAGGIIIEMSFGTNKLDAVSQLVPGTPPLFFVNSDTPPDRKRFSLAHELGHVVAHIMPNSDNHEQEREADKFSASFLMPAEDIAASLGNATLPVLAKLKSYWKVSIAALAMRAYDLGKINDWQKRRVFEELSRNGWRVKEPVDLKPEKPSVFLQILEVHRREFGFSQEDMSKVALLHEHEFAKHYSLQGNNRPVLRLVG